MQSLKRSVDTGIRKRSGAFKIKSKTHGFRERINNLEVRSIRLRNQHPATICSEVQCSIKRFSVEHDISANRTPFATRVPPRIMGMTIRHYFQPISPRSVVGAVFGLKIVRNSGQRKTGLCNTRCEINTGRLKAESAANVVNQIGIVERVEM